jgi:hypothetical protein
MVFVQKIYRKIGKDKIKYKFGSLTPFANRPNITIIKKTAPEGAAFRLQCNNISVLCH